MADRDDDDRAERRAPRKQAEPTLAPWQHLRRTGGRPDLHAAAGVLHGWALHEHHAGEPIQLTAADYAAAIEAVDARPLRPHPGALSPHAGRSM